MMTDREELITQKFIALIGFAKLARDRSLLGDYSKAMGCLKHTEVCLRECKRVISEVLNEKVDAVNHNP